MTPVFKRAVILVLDGLGIGELPDAALFGDSGSNTLGNLAKATGGVDIPLLESLGLGNIEGVDCLNKARAPLASYGRMMEASFAKDTGTGHWEMAGVVLERPFTTYPRGLPEDMLERFTEVTGYGTLGQGRPASGTGIIEELGKEHIRTGRPIIYTSADSVFQIAAHEDVIPLRELYRLCGLARGFLDQYGIARVIARPFAGRPGSFKRTEWRRDFSAEPPGPTLLDKVMEAGMPVAGIGKIGDIFAHRGITKETHTSGDFDGIEKTVGALKTYDRGLIFTNLVDLDTLYGHRNDTSGYARHLHEVDSMLPEITGLLADKDIFFLTADHGCDPTTKSTDHSREYVPLLVFGKGLKKGVNLGTRKSFSDLGATVAEALGVAPLDRGASFLKQVLP